MFVDKATIYVQAGKGGDGVVTFRHEKFVPRGGPSGGNGGRGGDVYLLADPELNDLYWLSEHPTQKAVNGKNGQNNNKTGVSAPDLILRVPVGVSVYVGEDMQFMADLVEPGQELLVARGGRGGVGNACFANARRQTPHIATGGQTGELATITIELKLLADVGLVGFPNAGKSTLLTRVSNANAKIGDYAFTTLQPQLGVVQTSNFSRFTMADIPGLIEGAHEGKGLGFEFLRHVERCRVLLYVIDLTEDNPVKTLELLWNEIKLWNEETFEKPAFIIGNKNDIFCDGDDALERFAKTRNIPYMRISALEKTGIKELIDSLWDIVKTIPKPETRVAQEIRLIDKTDEVTIEKFEDGWIVHNQRLERICAKTDYEEVDGKAFIDRQMRRLEIEKKLRKMGAVDGNVVIIGKLRFVLE
jgi:GTP-binding protein